MLRVHVGMEFVVILLNQCLNLPALILHLKQSVSLWETTVFS